MMMEIIDNNHAHELLTALNKQRRDCPDICDVQLKVQNDTLVAHRCVLSAFSGYFRALFTGGFGDCKQRECSLKDYTSQVTGEVISFLYTGKIVILPQKVEEMLSLADYLCIERLKEYCIKFMSSNITEESCIFIKYLCERFNLKELSDKVAHFIAPRVSGLLIQPDVLLLPWDFIKYLVTDSHFNYVNEQIICNLLNNWVKKDFENRKSHISELYKLIEPTYLPRSFIRKKILDPVLGVSNYLDESVRNTLQNRASETGLSSVLELLVCRSRSVTLGQEVQLLSYIPEDDSWHVLKTPQSHLLDGLESLIKHQNAIYFLVSKTEDMYGYMHHSQESKYFYKFNLPDCTWEFLQPPSMVRGASRLVSHCNGIYAIDRRGMLEEYDSDSKHWAVVTVSPFFDNPNSTCYVLPMPFDRFIFLLRVFSSGYAYAYSQVSFAIYKVDTVRRTQEKLAEIEACEIDIDEKEKIHGYIAQPDCIVMKNELGQPRLRFDLINNEFAKLEPKTQIPNFITDVWGSVLAVGKVYFVGKSKIDQPIFMFYDFIRRRFKATAVPPTYLSGLMCHVTFPRDACQNFLSE